MSAIQQHNPLSIERSLSEGVPTLGCSGRLTLEAAEFFKSEVKALAPDHKLVLADLSGVDYVDSSGLGSLVSAFISASNSGCELKLVKVHPRAKDLLNITHLSKVFREVS